MAWIKSIETVAGAGSCALAVEPALRLFLGDSLVTAAKAAG
jgi:hypothetical protein